jgi:hydrogenase nickel incorporation protein HypA/HybF
MHELSIAQSILAIVEKTVPINEQKKVVSIRLQIGVLSGIEIDALTYSFAIICKSSKLLNATLDIDIVPGKAVCQDCNNVYEYNSYGNPCPTCKSYSVKITQGKEMKILNVVTN